MRPIYVIRVYFNEMYFLYLYDFPLVAGRRNDNKMAILLKCYKLLKGSRCLLPFRAFDWKSCKPCVCCLQYTLETLIDS